MVGSGAPSGSADDATGGTGDRRGTGVGDADGGADRTDLRTRLGAVGGCLAAGVLGLVFVQLWALVVGTFAFPLVGGSFSAVENLLLTQPASGLGMVTGAVAYLRFTDRDVSFLDLPRPGLRDVGYVVLGLVALFGVLQVLDVAFSAAGVTTSEHGAMDAIRSAAPWQVALLVVGAVVFIGPGEEVLFRNVIQKRLYGPFSRHGAILVASLVFGAIHFNAYANGTGWEILASLAVVATLSVILGWIYHRTDSVVVPALVHGLYDAIVFASVYLGAN